MEKRADDGLIMEVRDLSVRYGEETILKDVNLDVYRGEILVVAGPSGCGKSTLLRHMIGLSAPLRGRITIDGVNIASATEEVVRKVRRGMGMLFQSSALLGSMTLAENVALPLTEFTDLSGAFIEKVVRMKLAMVDLSGYEGHLPSEPVGRHEEKGGYSPGPVP